MLVLGLKFRVHARTAKKRKVIFYFTGYKINIKECGKRNACNYSPTPLSFYKKPVDLHSKKPA